jgi:hypothetical protein
MVVSSDPSVPGDVTLDGDLTSRWVVPASVVVVPSASAEAFAEETVESSLGPDGLPLPGASLVFDLGAWTPISKVRWVGAVEGIAGQMRVEVSDDGITWVSISSPGQLGNSTDGIWQELLLGPHFSGGRFVRFAFENANGDPFLGGIAEVEIWS